MKMNSASGLSNLRVRKVFLDTEFTDFVQCDLISIGLVAETGEEFYGENADFSRAGASEFVKAAVYPLLTPRESAVKRFDLSVRVWKWLDELDCDKVEIHVDYQSDWDLLLDLLDEPHPKLLPANYLFNALAGAAAVKAALACPGSFAQIYDGARQIFYTEFLQHFIDTGDKQHHALADARGLRRGYLAAARHLQLSTY